MSMEWLQRSYPLTSIPMLSYQIAPHIIEGSNPVDVIMINNHKCMTPRIVKEVDLVSSNNMCLHGMHGNDSDGVDPLKTKRLEEECVTVITLQESTSHGSPFIDSISKPCPKFSPKKYPSYNSFEVVCCNISSPSHSLSLPHNIDTKAICCAFTKWKYELQCLDSQFINRGLKCYENVMETTNDWVDVDEKLINDLFICIKEF